MARRPAPRRPERGRGPADSGGAGSAELRLPVWQFVRLMVQVEETLAQGPDRPAAALSAAWGAVWKEVDAALTRLGSTDSQGFAELMMEQEVVLEEVTPALAQAAAKETAKVVRAMRATLGKGPKDEQRTEDLRFEIAELETTLKRLSRI